jgi:cell division protein FtsI (penicillin-binding protein 3)
LSEQPARHAAPAASSVAHRFGAPPGDAVPRTEHVRVTAPDLRRRAALEHTRGRLVIVAAGFAVLFALVIGKLVDATVVNPVKPRMEAQQRRPDPLPAAVAGAPASPGAPAATPAAAVVPPPAMAASDFGPRVKRASITDRNGEALAISLPYADLHANPQIVYDVDDVIARLRGVLPKLDPVKLKQQLTQQDKQFVYLARRITMREQLQINALGIPGIDFEFAENRRYPMGMVAAQVLGGVDIDGLGQAGVEKFFDERLRTDRAPLRLSIDVRVQAVVRDELSKSMAAFNAIGGTGIVMDVRSGEVLAMVSLPDYDANHYRRATDDQRFNRAISGRYEPGSTFKLQTAAMALDSGASQLWSSYDASSPIHFGRFTINDFEGKKRALSFPEFLAYSSNIAAAKVAMAVGAERQRAWHARMGMMAPVPIELPETFRPLVPPVANWKDIATMTIGFGHGISVTPLHVVRATAAVAYNGVLVRPTILAREADAPLPAGERVMSQQTSDTMRKLMRLIVSDGFGKTAEVPGYFIGGKTGTAEKSGRGGYKKKANVQAFTSVFPMQAPRYAVYFMLDEAKANASTHGYATAGWVAAPGAGRVVARIGPMLGLLPETTNAPAIAQSLAIPLVPGRPAGAVPAVRPAPPAAAAPRPAPPAAAAPRAPQPSAVAPPRAAPAAPAPAAPAAAPPVPRDPRHEATVAPPGGGTVVAVR